MRKNFLLLPSDAPFFLANTSHHQRNSPVCGGAQVNFKNERSRPRINFICFQRFHDSPVAVLVHGRLNLSALRKYLTHEYSSQMQQRFFLQILLFAQHVSGTTMPIIRSSRVLYNGCCLWYFVLWFSSFWSGVELRVMCPVCRMLLKAAHNPQLHTGPAT